MQSKPVGREARHDHKSGDEVIEILHITDCHLSASSDGELLGVNTLESFDAVLNKSLYDGLEPDMILLTGDLAQDGSPQAYQCLKDRLKSYACPAYWFAGNHDDRANMEQVVGDGSELSKVVRMGAWQIILLDSMVTRKVHGKLAESELAILKEALSDQPDLNTLVCLHHHPVSIDCGWLDKIGLHNSEEFWQIIDQFSQVKAVLWGHIHQQVDSSRGAVKLMASPSTCIQFLPGSDDFAIDNVAPGYRTLRLHPDGRIETEVVRAENFDFTVDMASTGY